MSYDIDPDCVSDIVSRGDREALDILFPAAGYDLGKFMDKQMRSLLHVAASQSGQDLVPLLLLRGCSVETKDSRGWTAIHFHAHYGTVRGLTCILKFLCCEATIEPSRATELINDTTGDTCQTALDLAIASNHTMCYRVLSVFGGKTAEEVQKRINRRHAKESIR